MRADISQPSSVREESNLPILHRYRRTRYHIATIGHPKVDIYYSINNSVSRTSQTSETASDGRQKTSGISTCHLKRTMDIGSDSNAHRLTVRVGLSPGPLFDHPLR